MARRLNHVSRDCCDFLSQLIVLNPDLRLGANGIEELKSHPWFDDVEWDRIEARTVIPPALPSLPDISPEVFHLESLKGEFNPLPLCSTSVNLCCIIADFIGPVLEGETIPEMPHFTKDFAYNDVVSLRVPGFKNDSFASETCTKNQRATVGSWIA